MARLNLEGFNDILFKALKNNNPEGRLKLLEAEMSLIADEFIRETAILLDELEETGYESEQFKKILNIKANSEGLLDQIEELKAIIESSKEQTEQ